MDKFDDFDTQRQCDEYPEDVVYIYSTTEIEQPNYRVYEVQGSTDLIFEPIPHN